MILEDILAIPPKVLTGEQRESYFRNGYLMLESIISDAWIAGLRAATDEMIEESRQITSRMRNGTWRTATRLKARALRRLSSPNDHHPAYWEYASRSIVPDIVADLVGPNVKFHHSKLNFKWAQGGEEVKWHQDIGFWPHTNYGPWTVGTYIYDCDIDQGPVGMIPGSHDGALFDQYNDKGGMDWLPAPGGRGDRGPVESPLSCRPGRVIDHPQLPHDPRLEAQPVRPVPALVVERLRAGRCHALYPQPPALEVRPSHRPRRGPALGPP